MNKITKYLISILFTIAACVAAGSVGAQTWSGGTNNCLYSSGYDEYFCRCPQGWTYAVAANANCGMNDGTLGGCWNPSTGTCNTCGQGGTIALGSYACFGGGGNSGQQNTAVCTGDNSSCSSVCLQNSSCQMFGTSANGTSYGETTYYFGSTTGGGCEFYAPYDCYSDIRLKRDIVLLGQTDHGIKLYSFKYLWSDQVYVGLMAQDLLENSKWQDAVITNTSGYYSVNYSKLGLEMVTLEQYQQQSTVALLK